MNKTNLLPGGLSVLHTLVTLCDIEILDAAKGALRHGVIVDLHESALAAKPRRREAREQLALA